MEGRRERTVPAIRVHQWMPSWDAIEWKPAEYRGEPPRSFFQFALGPSVLRRLSGVQRRTTRRRSAAEDLGIQRQLDVTRAAEIGRFVEFGFPWSDLSEAKRIRQISANSGSLDGCLRQSSSTFLPKRTSAANGLFTQAIWFGSKRPTGRLLSSFPNSVMIHNSLPRTSSARSHRRATPLVGL